jgi:hypothetical protein
MLHILDKHVYAEDENYFLERPRTCSRHCMNFDGIECELREELKCLKVIS